MTRRIYIYISRSCHRDRLPTTSCRKDQKKGEDNGPGRVACTVRVGRKVSATKTKRKWSKYNLELHKHFMPPLNRDTASICMRIKQSKN